MLFKVNKPLYQALRQSQIAGSVKSEPVQMGRVTNQAME